jgi:hypothetical protein
LVAMVGAIHYTKKKSDKKKAPKNSYSKGTGTEVGQVLESKPFFVDRPSTLIYGHKQAQVPHHGAWHKL